MITVIQSAEAEGRRMGRRSVKHPLQLDLIPVRPAGGREAQGLVQMAGGRVFRADGQPDEVGSPERLGTDIGKRRSIAALPQPLPWCWASIIRCQMK